MYPVIPLPGGLYLPSYFFVITLAYCLGIFWLYKRADRYDLSVQTAMDLAILTMVGGFVGSRLFHVFFEHPRFYWENPFHILKVWQGGFVFYGGVIGAVIPVLWLIKQRQESYRQWMDIFAPIIPLVYAIGRFATLLSGSGYGKPTHLPWGITYPPGTEAPAGISLHPTPIYALIWELGVLFISLILLSKNNFPPGSSRSGFTFGVVVMLHGLGRAIIEQYRDDFRGELIFGFTISTWLSLGLIVLGAFICRNTLKKPSTN
jgi:phosphatidylglycerol:prolipoprotein diacylglycerol transferase